MVKTNWNKIPPETVDDAHSQGAGEQGEVLERRVMGKREVQNLIRIMLETARLDDTETRADMLGGVAEYLRQLGSLEAGAQEGIIIADGHNGPEMTVIGGDTTRKQDDSEDEPDNPDGGGDNPGGKKKGPEAQPAGSDAEDAEDSEEEKARKKKLEELKSNDGFMDWYKKGLSALGDSFDEDKFDHLSMDRLTELEKNYNEAQDKAEKEKTEEERKKKLKELKQNKAFMDWYGKAPDTLDGLSLDELNKHEAEYKEYDEKRQALLNKLMSDIDFINWAKEKGKITVNGDLENAKLDILQTWSAEYEKEKLFKLQNELVADRDFTNWAMAKDKIKDPKDLLSMTREELENLKAEYESAKKKEAIDRIKNDPKMMKWLTDNNKIKAEGDLDKLSLDDLKKLEAEFVATLNTNIVADVTLKNEGSERARHLAEAEISKKIAESSGVLKVFMPKHWKTKFWTAGMGKEVEIRKVQKEIIRQIELSAKLEAEGGLSEEEQKELDALNKKRQSDPSWWGASTGDVSRFIHAHMEAHDDWILEDENMKVYKIINGEVKVVKRVKGEDGKITEEVSELGEKDGNVGEVMKGVEKAIQEYVESDDSDPNARDKLRETLARLKASYTGRDDKFPFILDNYIEIAENAKLRAKHENGIKNVLEGFTLIRGEMNRDASSVSKSNLARRAGEFAANHHLRWVPETVAVTAAVVAVSVGQSLVRRVGTVSGAALAGAIGGVVGAAAVGTVLMELRHVGDLKELIATQTREVATGAEAGQRKLDQKIFNKVIEPLLYDTVEGEDGKEHRVKVTAEGFTKELSQGADDLQAALDRLEADPSILNNSEELGKIRYLADWMSTRSAQAKLRIIEGRKNHIDLMAFSSRDLSQMESERLQVLIQADRVESLCEQLRKKHGDVFRDHEKDLNDYELSEQTARTQLFGGTIKLPSGETVESKGVVDESRKGQRGVIGWEVVKSTPLRFSLNTIMTFLAGEAKAEISKNETSLHEALTGGENFFGRKNNEGAADSLLTAFFRSKGKIPPEIIDTNTHSEKFATQEEAQQYLNEHGGGSPIENPQPDSITQGTSGAVGEEYGEPLGGERLYFHNGTSYSEGAELGLSGDGRAEWYLNSNFHGIATNGAGEAVNLDQAMANGEINLLVFLKGSSKPIEIPGQMIDGRYGFPTSGLPSSVISAMEHGDMSMVQVTQTGLNGGFKNIFASVPMGEGGGSGAIYDIHTPNPSTWTAEWVENVVADATPDTVVLPPPIITPVGVGGTVTRKAPEGTPDGDAQGEGGTGKNPGENSGDNPGGNQTDGHDGTGMSDGTGGVLEQPVDGAGQGGSSTHKKTGESVSSSDTEEDDSSTEDSSEDDETTETDTTEDGGENPDGGAQPAGAEAEPQAPKVVTPESVAQDGIYEISVDYNYVHEKHPELDGWIKKAVDDWNALMTPERATEILNGGATGWPESMIVDILTRAGLIEIRKPAEKTDTASGNPDSSEDTDADSTAAEGAGEAKPTVEEIQAKYGFPITHEQTRAARKEKGKIVKIDEAKVRQYLRERGASDAVIRAMTPAIGRWNGSLGDARIESFMSNRVAGTSRDYGDSIRLLSEWGIVKPDWM